MNVQTDRTLIRSVGGSSRYILATFSAPDAGQAAVRHPVNIAFVLDRSGSMAGSKIALAKQALAAALRMLRPADRFAVVVYDDIVDLVVGSTSASSEAIENALRQVEAIDARGRTDLGGGWLRGCEQIAQRLDPSQIGKCLLLTDGLANHGITDPAELERHARELRSRGIATSTLGLGHNFNEELLQRMADAGGGRSYYIETAVQIADTLTSELGETLETVARGVTLTVKTAPGATVAPLNVMESGRPDEETTAIHLGDLVSRQSVSLILHVRFPAGGESTTSRALLSLSDAGGVLPASETDCIWTYADDAANDRQPRNVAVDREVARLYAARARQEAIALNGEGRFDQAQRRLRAVADRIRTYAGADSVLNRIVEELEESHVVYGNVVGAAMAKSDGYAAYYASHMRGADGKSRRQP